MRAFVERANQEVLRHLKALLFDSRVHDKWSFEQLPLVQRIMNTVEKTSTGVTGAHPQSFHPPVISCNDPISGIDSSDTSLSDRMDEWISRQHTLLVVAQENQLKSDQHQLVENDPDITNYPIYSYVLFTPPTGRSNKLLPKCDTAVRTQYVLNVTSPVSLLTQTSFHHTFCTVHTVHPVCSLTLL